MWRTEQVEKSNARLRSPQVFFPELMGFFLGSTIAKHFAAAERPRCNCSVCDGDGLDRFTSMEGDLQREAAGHNIEVMRGCLNALMAVPSGYERQKKWHELCHAAKEHHDTLNTSLGLKKGFRVDAQLKRWALLVPASAPGVASATQTTR